jgi:hypothetical protein
VAVAAGAVVGVGRRTAGNVAGASGSVGDTGAGVGWDVPHAALMSKNAKTRMGGIWYMVFIFLSPYVTVTFPLKANVTPS